MQRASVAVVILLLLLAFDSGRPGTARAQLPPQARPVSQEREKGSGIPSISRFAGDAAMIPADAPLLRQPFPDRRFIPVEGELLVLTGQANMVREQERGVLEALLVRHFVDAPLRIRNMAWEGDTVFEQWRDLEFGSWKDQLDAAGASSVAAWFGQIEALEAGRRAELAGRSPGDPGVVTGERQRFKAAYGALLDQFQSRTRRLIVIAPLLFEPPRPGSRLPDLSRSNRLVSAFSEVARELADERGAVFVDPGLGGADGDEARGETFRTTNGIHLDDAGWREVAERMARGMGVSAGSDSGPIHDALLDEIRSKNRLWFNCWRAMNWAFAYGDRTAQLFGTADGGRPSLTEELGQFVPLVAAADERIHLVAAGRPASPRSFPPSGSSDPGPPGISAEEEQASFRLPEGFSVNLFASEADGVVNPVRMNWDASGRLWVCCIPTYPHIDPGTEAADYILVCEDTDQDGRADRFTRFAEGLFLPMGVEFSADGVWICENTRLVHLRDTDGDGRADEKEVVLSGFGTADTHQLINSLRWGADGALWFSQGHHIYSRVETPWGISRLDKAGIWRFDPRRLHLQGFFNLSTAGANDWGVVFDDWGQVFHGTGDRNVAFYSVPGLVPTLFPRDYNGVGAVFQSQAKNTGLDFLGSSALPPPWRGHAVMGIFMGNAVEIHRALDDGAGFRTELVETLMASDRTEFRPVDVAAGPDGGVYVCDWFNRIIGHYQTSYRHPERDRSHGRIWRVRWDQGAAVPRIDLAAADAEALLDALRSDERWVRDMARRRLFVRERGEVLSATGRLVAEVDLSRAENGALAIDVLGVLAGQDEPDENLLRLLLAHPDFRVRAVAVRFVGLWGNRFSEADAFLRAAIEDEHPRVRLEAVVACGWTDPSGAGEGMEIAVRVLDRPTDRFIVFALGQTAQALAPAWTDALAQGRIDFEGRTDHLAFALEALGGAAVGEHVRALVDRIEASAEPVPPGLLALLADIGTASDLERAFHLGIESPTVLDAVARALRSRDVSLSDSMAGELEALLSGSGEGADELAAAALHVAGAARWSSLHDAVRRLAFSTESTVSVRAAAFAALPEVTREKERLADELARFLDAACSATTEASTMPVVAAALGSLWRMNGASAARFAARIAAGDGSALEAADPLIDAVLGAPDGPGGFAAALAEIELAPASAARLLEALRERGVSHAALTDTLSRLAGTAGIGTPRHDPGWIRSLVDEVNRTGDPQRGRAVYARAEGACIACHRIEGEGGTIGPDLSLLGRGVPIELIIEAILWPKLQIKEGYFLTEIQTADGRTHIGYRARESDSEISLQPIGGAGDIISIAKRDVISRHDAGSAMPEGLAADLTRDDLRDLVAYLAGLGRED